VTDIQRLFIKNLRLARAKARLSQSGLAERCGLTANYLAELEAGRRFPSHETLQRLCNELDLRPYELFVDIEFDFRPLDADDGVRNLKDQVRQKLKELIDELK
jgi:transcriptional regulator with XRE-family HTH domain